MCFCWPFHDYVVKKAPNPKKKPEEIQHHVDQPGDVFYPVNMPYYQYGTTQSERVTVPAPTAEEHDFNGEPTVYQYNPPVRPTVTAAPSAPAAQAAPTADRSQVVYVPVPPHGYTPVLGQQVSYIAVPGAGGPHPYVVNHVHHTMALPIFQTTQHAPPPPPPPAPPGVVPWQGPTSAEVQARCIPKTSQFVPYNPTLGQTWWCKELDGTYTERTTNDIMENCQPGRWGYAAATDHPYFIREPATSGS